MMGRRFNARIEIALRSVAVLLLACTCIATGQPSTQNPVQAQSVPPTGAGSTRACSANPVLASASAKKKTHKLKHPPAPEPPPTCVELKGQAIEVQEFLQNTARARAWRIGENRASEDTWSFVRYLSAEELEQFADTKVLLEEVDFTNGKVAILVRTSDLGDGYVRVQITPHFQGEGKSTDKITPQPGTLWPLNSKGVLEQEMVNALQTGYKPLE